MAKRMKVVLSLAGFAAALVQRIPAAELVSAKSGGTVDPTGVTLTAIQPDATVPVTFYSAMCPADAQVDAEGFAPDMPRDIALYGSNDGGATWTLVDEEPYSIGWKPGERRYWACAQPGKYAQYRFDAPNAELYAPSPRTGATYCVDAATGDDTRTPEAAQNRATPWRTISRAAAAMVAGDTALVAPGIYREQVTIDKKHVAGTVIDPMTFRALDPADRPIVSGAELLDPTAWRETIVTNFRGKAVACLVREIDWKPMALFAGLQRLVEAHEPEQVNGDDPYDLGLMNVMSMEENPDPFSKTRMVDSAFFVQTERDYWAGGRLKIYDRFSNTCEERGIVAYDPAAHTITTETFTQTLGNNRSTSPDLWTICGHLGVMDAPGEFCVVGDAAPYRLYFVPSPDIAVATLAATRFEYGFSFVKSGIVIDGFRFQSQSKVGVYSESKNVQNVRVRNCEFSHILGSGARFRGWKSVGIERCVITANTDNGLSFADCVNAHVYDCSISTNGNNGIWSGNGETNRFSDTGLKVMGCHIFDQAGRRSHADNYQIHQNDNVVIVGNRFTQQGEQNGWCQYTGHMIFRDNVFTGGPFGFNSVRYAEIAHNVFDGSTLRFDAHLSDSPTYGAWYCPIRVDIFANVIRDSSINWPSETLVDRFTAFNVRGNLFLFDSGSSNARKNWDWKGRILTVKRGTLFICEEPLVEAAPGAVASPFDMISQVTWSNPGFMVPLYRDADNYYWFGIGNNPTFNRVTNGVNVVLAKDIHASAAHGRSVEITNRVTSAFAPTGISFAVSKNGEEKFTFTDSDANAVATFSGPLRHGFGNPTNGSDNAWFQVVSVTVGAARRTFETTNGWTAVTGAVSLANIDSYGGVGFDAGSVVIVTNEVPPVAALTPDDLSAVTTPDGFPVGPLGFATPPAEDEPIPPAEPPSHDIATAAELVAKLTSEPTGEFTLTADISFTGTGFDPFATFAGRLHGAGHVISGLGTSPLFTELRGAVDGLILDGAVEGAPASVNGGTTTGFAPLALTATGATVSNCVVKGYAISATSKGKNIAGFVLNATDGTTFVGCTLDESVTLNGNVNLEVGGLVATVTCAADGTALGARFVSCTNNAAVGNSGGNYNPHGVGGLVGSISHNTSAFPLTEFVGCVNNGRITGGKTCLLGGLVGSVNGVGTTAVPARSQRVSLVNCENRGTVLSTADGTNAGGFVGGATCGAGFLAFTGCVNRAGIAVSGNGWVGGFVGYHDNPNKASGICTEIVRSANVGRLVGANAGGLIGHLQANDGWACGVWRFIASTNDCDIVLLGTERDGATAGQLYGTFTGTVKSTIKIVAASCWTRRGNLAGAASSREPTEADVCFLPLERLTVRALQGRVNCERPGATSAYAVGFKNAVTTNGIDFLSVDNYKNVAYLNEITPDGYTLVGRNFNGSQDANTRVIGWKTDRFRVLAGGDGMGGTTGVPASNSSSGWIVLADVATGDQFVVYNAWYSLMKGKTVAAYVTALGKQVVELLATYPRARFFFFADYSALPNETSDFATTYGGEGGNVLAAIVAASGLVPVQAGDDFQWTLVDTPPTRAAVCALRDANVSTSAAYVSTLRFGPDSGLRVLVL